jgi:hypothetical protein
MAQGRDFQRLSPRWLNCTLCAAGLTGAGFFIWRALFVEGDQTASLVPRLLGAAVLPILLCATAVCRAARRVVGL